MLATIMRAITLSGSTMTGKSTAHFWLTFAEDQAWPAVGDITTSHLEDYFSYLWNRPKWFGERDKGSATVSGSHVETQYRRIRRFFQWLVERGRIGVNPLFLIPHPKFDEKVIETDRHHPGNHAQRPEQIHS